MGTHIARGDRGLLTTVHLLAIVLQRFSRKLKSKATALRPCLCHTGPDIFTICTVCLPIPSDYLGLRGCCPHVRCMLWLAPTRYSHAQP